MSLSSKLLMENLDPGYFKGKRVLIRVDFNVPLDSELKITNNARITAALPTIKLALKNESSKVILMSHLGRPNGAYSAKDSLKPVYEELKALLSTGDEAVLPAEKIFFTNDCVGEEVKNTITEAPEGSVILLENLRFHLEEEGSKKEGGVKIKATEEATVQFRKGLTELGDLYINDAFGTAHRPHSSMVGVGGVYNPEMKRAAGLLMANELTFFAQALEFPQKPFLAILGGAKVSDKVALIQNMMKKVDQIIIGGAMALTFAFTLGHNVGASKVDQQGAAFVKTLYSDPDADKIFVLPTDYFTTKKDFFMISDDSESEPKTKDSVLISEGLAGDEMGVDIGSETIKKFCDIIYPEDATKQPMTILWNGPPGVFEFGPYAKGSKAMLEACEKAMTREAKVIVGGGDTATVVSKFGDAAKLTHVSTGGGASLELLEGKELPGVTALSDK